MRLEPRPPHALAHLRLGRGPRLWVVRRHEFLAFREARVVLAYARGGLRVPAALEGVQVSVFAVEEVQHLAPLERDLAVGDVDGEAGERGVVDRATYADGVVWHFGRPVRDVFLPASRHFVELLDRVSRSFVLEPHGVALMLFAQPRECGGDFGALAFAAEVVFLQLEINVDVWKEVFGEGGFGAPAEGGGYAAA